MKRCLVINKGSIPYRDAFDLQKRAVERLKSGAGDESLVLLEHPHVVTIGRNSTRASLLAGERELAERGVDCVQTDRGGDVTYHGPGQLVGYPIIRLETPRRDIRRYVHDLEEVLIRTLGDFGVDGGRHAVHRGVWAGDRKIASLGIRISKWVTCHGFALNVNTDLSYFSLITPCGIDGCEMTSIAALSGAPVDMGRVRERVAVHFGGVFGRALAAESPNDLAVTHGY